MCGEPVARKAPNTHPGLRLCKNGERVETSPRLGGGTAAEAQTAGLSEVRASLQRLLPSLLGPERHGMKRAHAVLLASRAQRAR